MQYDRPQFQHVLSYAADADHDVVDTVSGNPDWDPPESLRTGLAEYAEEPTEQFQYPPSEGLDELRTEIATRRGVDRERVVVTNGAGEANYLALAAALDAADGDEVVLTDPVYPYYPAKAKLLDATPRSVPTAPDGSLVVERFAEVIGPETAVVVLNTPNNPTGAVYDPDTVAAVAELAADADATLVVDEVYHHFDYSGRFESALTMAEVRETVAVTCSFSKSLAITGFRVGYTVLPERLVDHATTRHMLVNVTASRPAQAAVLRALRETGPAYYEQTRATLRERVATFCDALDAAGFAYTDPDGAFYVLAKVDGLPGTMANTERLIDEAGVAPMPGATFGEAYADWFRFALVTPRVETAAERLREWADARDAV
ncbi:pyridoxal phosphate-dependent aminotransferase [Halobaculum sp. MBLA0147]|uniref:pyridoxal phosphate-dependent aminotransferase n=1 Tax=Halobaculum sp. MBLA0147 TaxID=3079934 RepID=UPI003525CC67